MPETQTTRPPHSLPRLTRLLSQDFRQEGRSMWPWCDRRWIRCTLLPTARKRTAKHSGTYRQYIRAALARRHEQTGG